jgi:hypothetical protein
MQAIGATTPIFVRHQPSAVSGGAPRPPANLKALPGNGVVGGPHTPGLGMIGGPAYSRIVNKASIDGSALRRRY